MVWQDRDWLEKEYGQHTARSMTVLKESCGDGLFVVYEVHERGVFSSDPEFWVTTLPGLHLGLYSGEPSFSMTSMKKDEFLTMVYKNRKREE